MEIEDSIYKNIPYNANPFVSLDSQRQQEIK